MSSITHPASPGDTFQFWHGAQKWSGRPEIRPSRPKSYEGGPGFYLTNDLDRAKQYAKGAGCLVEVSLSAQTRWLSDHRVPHAAMFEFLESRRGLRGRSSIVEGLKKAIEREQGDTLFTAALLNLCVNADALNGAHGPALAKWMTEQGVDAVHDSMMGESWVVVFNPEVIEKIQVHRVATIDPFASFPTLDKQRARLAGIAQPVVASPSPRRHRSSP